jgi:hypothetical protein
MRPSGHYASVTASTLAHRPNPWPWLSAYVVIGVLAGLSVVSLGWILLGPVALVVGISLFSSTARCSVGSPVGVVLIVGGRNTRGVRVVSRAHAGRRAISAVSRPVLCPQHGYVVFAVKVPPRTTSATAAANHTSYVTPNGAFDAVDVTVQSQRRMVLGVIEAWAEVLATSARSA